jgi:hypothetical protein
MSNESPLSVSPTAVPVVPDPAPSLTPPEARPGTARTGGGALHRIRPHWRYTRTAGDAICGPCAWVLLYQDCRRAAFLTLSIASGFILCTRCGRLEA